MATAMSAGKVITLEEVLHLLDARVLCGNDLAIRLSEVGAADLMSDVLALSKPGMLLLTGLVSIQVIRTAVVSDLCGVVFVRGKMPGEDIIGLARETNMPVFSTAMTMFQAAGVLYGALSGR